MTTWSERVDAVLRLLNVPIREGHSGYHTDVRDLPAGAVCGLLYYDAEFKSKAHCTKKLLEFQQTYLAESETWTLEPRSNLFPRLTLSVLDVEALETAAQPKTPLAPAETPTAEPIAPLPTTEDELYALWTQMYSAYLRSTHNPAKELLARLESAMKHYTKASLLVEWNSVLRSAFYDVLIIGNTELLELDPRGGHKTDVR